MFIRNLSKLVLTAVAALSLAGCQGGILDPKGQVGVDEKSLIIISTLLMLIVVIPVIVMTLYFAWKYREGRGQTYTPEWSHSTKIEAAVWLIPVVIIFVLAIVTWRSTQDLDPYKPLGAPEKHLTVQVISLDWKWLFIYPEQGIATVNELVIPSNVPVKFKITSDTVMNSFFIPQLGSQIYSMVGMETQLHLIANHPGTYDGFSANYSGAGYSNMQFKTIATPSEADFNKWVNDVKSKGEPLTAERYAKLTKPSEEDPVTYFSSVKKGLFHHIIMHYMQNYGVMDYKDKPANSAHPVKEAAE